MGGLLGQSVGYLPYFLLLCVVDSHIPHILLFFPTLSDDLTSQLLKAPKEIALGVVFGVLLGLIAAWLPHKEDVSSYEYNNKSSC